MTYKEARIILNCVATDICGQYADKEMPEGVKRLYSALDEAIEALDQHPKPKIIECEYCGKKVVASSGKFKYCDECSKTITKIYNEKRKDNKCRYLHKRICDIYTNTLKQPSDAFRIASNAFWKEVKAGNKSETEYMEWLINEKNKISKRNRKDK